MKFAIIVGAAIALFVFSISSSFDKDVFDLVVLLSAIAALGFLIVKHKSDQNEFKL